MQYREFKDTKLSLLGFGAMRLPVIDGDDAKVIRFRSARSVSEEIVIDWCNMWLCIEPTFFAPSENPWYYIMGIVCLFFAVRGLVVYNKLPEKAVV